MLVPPRILNLTVLDLDQLAQVFVLFLQRLVLLHDGLLFLFGLGDAGLVLLLLLSKLSDFALEIGHKLVFLADHAGDCLLRVHEQIRLFVCLSLVLLQLVLNVTLALP